MKLLDEIFQSFSMTQCACSLAHIQNKWTSGKFVTTCIRTLCLRRAELAGSSNAAYFAGFSRANSFGRGWKRHHAEV